VAKVLLVRHAQSEWNAAGRWQGWANPPLSALGRAQAEQAGDRLRRTAEPIGRAVSSDLDRARTTATIIAGIAGAPELVASQPVVEEVAGLRELDVGEWSGLTRAQIAAEWPESLADWQAGVLDTPPGGEERASFDARVRAAFAQVVADLGDERLLVVAHGGVVRSIGQWLGIPATPRLHVAGFWLDTDGDRIAITDSVDLLQEDPNDGPAGHGPPGGASARGHVAPAGASVPDDSAGAR
jgi:glucosyl-3-phosphoglycerate phosphatase